MTRTRLIFLTRQPRIILRVLLAVLCAGIGVAWVVGKIVKPERNLAEEAALIRDTSNLAEAPTALPEEVDDLPAALFQALLPQPLDEDALVLWLSKLRQREFPLTSPKEVPALSLRDLRGLIDWWEDLTPLQCNALAKRALREANFPAARTSLFLPFIHATWLEGPPRVAAQQALQQLADASPPCPLANALLGEMWLGMHEPEQALAAFRREGTRPEAAAARRQALLTCVQYRLANQLAALLQQPGYAAERDSLSAEQRSLAAILLGEYPALLRVHGERMVQSIREHPVETLLTLMCGLIWFILLHQLGGLPMRRAWRGALAVALGCLSPLITLFLWSMQTQVVGLDQTGDFWNDLLFFISGVGLREEVSKLLLFAPLLWYLRGKSEAEILVTAGCVGLGFAVEENIQYFAHGLGSSPLSRLVSANFLHVAMTGLAGLALAKWVRFPRSCWESGLTTIIAVIVLHGLYDFTIGAQVPHPALSLNHFPPIIILALAHYFLTHLKHVGQARSHVIGPLFAFLTGLAMLLSFALIAATLESGFHFAMESLVVSGLGSIMLILMFIYHLRHE